MTSLAEKLQHLRELGEKATGAPWRCVPEEFTEDDYAAPYITTEEHLIASMRVGIAGAQFNGPFIAASRTALPKLVEFAEGVRKRHKSGGTVLSFCPEVGPHECKSELLEMCEACEQPWHCPDIEALSKLGEGL